MWFWWIIFLVGGYLLGSLPSAYILVKAKKGLDIRKYGSGNVGSTNTMRVAGAGTGLIVFLMDALKGAIPVALALWVIREPDLAVCTGLTAFLGHLYPIWLSFSGGKGVAIAIGIACVLVPKIALLTFAIWLVVVLATGYVSVASCSGGVALALSCLFFGQPWLYTLVFSVLCGMVIVKHRRNFQNIANGTEGKAFGKLFGRKV